MGPAVPPGVRLKILVASGLLVVSATLAVTYAWFVPLATDGGWYSYPGYALAMGRDPAENLLTLDAIKAVPESVRAIFAYELRSFLIVPFHATWFTLAGTSLLSLKVFGLVQWVLLAALVVLTVRYVTGARTAAYVAGLATLSDSWVISQAIGDLRPDVPNALAATLCMLALLRYQKTSQWWWLALGVSTAVALALLHLTSILALTFLSTFALALVVMREQGARWRFELALVPACAFLAVLFRQPIMDLVVPTQLRTADVLPYRDDLWAAWQSVVAMGVWGKALFEADRWFDYFFLTNITQLLFIGLGAAGLAVASRRVEDRVSRAFLWAALVSVPVMMIIDPTHTRGHLVPLASLAYVGAGIGLAELLRSRFAIPAGHGVVVIGVIALALRTVLAADMVRSHGQHGISNPNVVQFMADVIDPESHHVVIAPTFLWPYVDKGSSVVMIEPGSRLWHSQDERWQMVSKVIIDRDFRRRGWGEFSAQMERCSSFVRESSVGSSSGEGFFLEAYRVVGKPCNVVD